MANTGVIAVPKPDPLFHPYLVIGFSVFAMSLGIIFIRIAQDESVPTQVIIAIRILLATLFITPFVLRNHMDVLRNMTRREWGLGFLAGIFFTGDFLMFTESINQTTILVAGVIGGSSSIWTAFLERSILKASISRNVWYGVILALVGGALIAVGGVGEDVSVGKNPLLGAGLAAGAAFFFACYLTTGRFLRSRLPMLVYTWMVFVAASVISWIVVIGSGVSVTGYSAEGYTMILAVTVTSQLLAHPGFNYSLAYVSATVMSMSGQMVTVVGAILALIAFNELPNALQIVGSVIVLIGVTIAGFRKRRAVSPAQMPVETLPTSL
jgi:drug/metabolite transporter (DMT)-like permease